MLNAEKELGGAPYRDHPTKPYGAKMTGVTSGSESTRRWSWGQVLGGSGVIISLLFVATEVRQNTEAVLGATFQQLSEGRRELLMEQLHDPSLNAAWGAWQSSDEAWAAVPDEERNKVSLWVGAYLGFLDNAYYQVQLGALPQAVFEGWRLPSAHSRFKEFWALTRTRYTEQFRTYMETTFELGAGGG